MQNIYRYKKIYIYNILNRIIIYRDIRQEDIQI